MVHSILFLERYCIFRVLFAEPLEETHAHAFPMRLFGLDNRLELLVIAYEDELLCSEQALDAGWLKALRSLIENGDVELFGKVLDE